MTEPLTIKIGKHEYTSKFVLADTRHDVILGTPWHKDVQPCVQYETVGRYGESEKFDDLLSENV